MPPENRTRVFISYSRRDEAFVSRLAAALDQASYFVDFDLGGDAAKIEGGIAPTDAWQARLAALIGAADVVVFVVSPDSAASTVCDWEIAQAQALAKRLVPVLWRPIDFASVPQRLAALNVAISFQADFDSGLGALVHAIETDIDWLREGRRLTTLATRWHGGGEPESQLLRSAEVAAAETWAARRPANAPQPADILFRFIGASRTKEEADLKRLRTITARGYVAETSRALAEGQYEEAIRLAATGALLADDLGFDLAPELWDALAPAIFENRLLCALNTAPVGGKSRHERAPKHVQLSADANSVLIVSAAGEAILWSVEAATPLLQLNESAVEAAIMSSDGSTVVTIADHSRLSAWDTATGKILWRVEKEYVGHQLHFSSDMFLVWTNIGAFDLSNGALVLQLANARSHRMAVSADGRYVATGNWNRDGHDTEVVIWEARQGREHKRIALRKNNITALKFAPASSRLLILYEEHNVAESRATEFGDGKYEALIADAVSGEITCNLSGHEGHINSAAFDSVGARVVTSSDDGTVRVWDAVTGAELSQRVGAPFRGLLGAYGAANDVSFAPDGPIIASVTNDGAVTLWHGETGKTLITHRHLRPKKSETRFGRENVASVQFDLKGQRLLTTAEDGSVCIWDAANSNVTLSLEGHIGRVTFVAISPASRWIATIEDNSILRVFDGKNGSQCAQFNLLAASSSFGESRGGVSSVCWFTRDGMRLVGLSDNGEFSRKFSSDERAASSVQVWDAGSWNVVEEIRGRGSVGGYLDATERFADPDDRHHIELLLGEDLAPTHNHQARIVAALTQVWGPEKVESERLFGSFKLSADGQTLLEEDWNEGLVHVWKVPTRERIASVAGNIVDAACAWTDDGRRLLVVRDGFVCIVSVPEGRVLFRFNEAPPQSACLSGDGTRLAVGFADGTARVLDVSRSVYLAGERPVILGAAVAAGVGVVSPREREQPSLVDAPSDLHPAILEKLTPNQADRAREIRSSLIRPRAAECYAVTAQAGAVGGRWSPAVEALRKSKVKRCVEGLFDANQPLMSHEAERIGHALTTAALEALVAKRLQVNADAGPVRVDDVSVVLDGVLELLEDIHHSPLRMNGELADDRGAWRLDVQPLWSIKNKKYELFDTKALASIAERYLRENFRSSAFDRLITRLLVGAEMYAFGDALYYTNNRATEQELTWRLLGAFLITPLLALGAGGFALAYALRVQIVGEWAHWVGFALGALFAILGMMLPGIIGGGLRKEIERRGKWTKLLGAMADAYQAVPETGLFSAKTLRTKLDEAATLGAVWPPALLSMLDDISVRASHTASLVPTGLKAPSEPASPENLET